MKGVFNFGPTLLGVNFAGGLVLAYGPQLAHGPNPHSVVSIDAPPPVGYSALYPLS